MRAEAKAGASPNNRHTRQEIARVNARARLSMPILATPEPILWALWFRGEDAAGLNVARSFTPHIAARVPRALPSRARTADSVSHWAINRREVAPKARRTAISFSLATARTSIRLATLTQAISNKTATAPRRSNVTVRYSPRN